MKVLVVQSCEYDRFQEAVAFARNQWPHGTVTALVNERSADASAKWLDGRHILAYGGKVGEKPVVSSKTATYIRSQKFDVCILPLNDRYGVRFLRFRLLPIWTAIPQIVTINCQGKISRYNKFSWIASTISACILIRLLKIPIPVLRANEENIMIGLLVLLALAGAALRTVGLHPLGRQWKQRGHISIRLFIFIPTLGMGGAQKVLINFLRRVDMKKYKIEVCTRDAPDKFFESEVKDIGTSLTYLPCKYDGCYWRVVWALTRHLYRTPPDAVIGWLPWATCFTAIAASIVGVPHILTSLHSQSPTRFPLAVPWWQRPLDVLTAYMIDTVIACSNACRSDYIAWSRISPSKIVTIYNGIDANSFQPCTEKHIRAIRARLNITSRHVIGIVGRLSPEKDHPTFFKAVQILRRAFPSLTALVVGDGPSKAHLTEKVQRMGLSDCVMFLGNRSDAPTIIACLDTLVLTSLTEGMPIVLLEAQALGVPVVTTAAGGAVEVVRHGETGFIVPRGDSDKVAESISELLLNQSFRQRLSLNGRRFVLEAFDSNQMAAAILQLINVSPLVAGGDHGKPRRLRFSRNFRRGSRLSS